MILTNSFANERDILGPRYVDRKIWSCVLIANKQLVLLIGMSFSMWHEFCDCVSFSMWHEFFEEKWLGYFLGGKKRALPELNVILHCSACHVIAQRSAVPARKISLSPEL